MLCVVLNFNFQDLFFVIFNFTSVPGIIFLERPKSISLMILELSPSNITFSGWLGFIVMMDVWICCRNEKVVENIVNMRKIYRGIMGIAMVKTFKSRWATLWLWRCCTPSRICLMKKLACNEYFSAKVQQMFQVQNDKVIIFLDIPYMIIFIVIIVIIRLFNHYHHNCYYDHYHHNFC